MVGEIRPRGLCQNPRSGFKQGSVAFIGADKWKPTWQQKREAANGLPRVLRWEMRKGECRLGAAEVGAVFGLDVDFLAGGDEQRDLDDESGLGDDGFVNVVG